MLIALVMRAVEFLCSIIQTVCFVIIAFELSPWHRKDNG